MNDHVERKIQEVYLLAVKLGLDNASDFEKEMFQKELARIAVAAVDSMRGDVSMLLMERSRDYQNYKP